VSDADRILKAITDQPGRSAREIAHCLGLTRREVDSLIYHALRGSVFRDERLLWYPTDLQRNAVREAGITAAAEQPECAEPPPVHVAKQPESSDAAAAPVALPSARSDGYCAECGKESAITKDGRFCRKCLKALVAKLTPMVGCFKGLRRTEDHKQARDEEGGPWQELARKYLEELRSDQD